MMVAEGWEEIAAGIEGWLEGSARSRNRQGEHDERFAQLSDASDLLTKLAERPTQAHERAAAARSQAKAEVEQSAIVAPPRDTQSPAKRGLIRRLAGTAMISGCPAPSAGLTTGQDLPLESAHRSATPSA
jgi:hypothetical protein